MNSIVVYEATPDSGLSLADRMGSAVAQQPTPEFLASIMKSQILLADHTPFDSISLQEKEARKRWQDFQNFSSKKLVVVNYEEVEVRLAAQFLRDEELALEGYEDNPFYVRKDSNG